MAVSPSLRDEESVIPEQNLRACEKTRQLTQPVRLALANRLRQLPGFFTSSQCTAPCGTVPAEGTGAWMAPAGCTPLTPGLLPEMKVLFPVSW